MGNLTASGSVIASGQDLLMLISALQTQVDTLTAQLGALQTQLDELGGN